MLLDSTWVEYLSSGPYLLLPEDERILTRLHPAPAIAVATGRGDVFINTFFGNGIGATTGGGNIRVTSLFCFCAFDSLAATPPTLQSCGDVKLIAGGSGRTVVSQALAAYSATFGTNHGEVVLANSGMIIAEDLTVSSSDGPVLMSNVIQVRHGRAVTPRIALRQ